MLSSSAPTETPHFFEITKSPPDNADSVLNDRYLHNKKKGEYPGDNLWATQIDERYAAAREHISDAKDSGKKDTFQSSKNEDTGEYIVNFRLLVKWLDENDLLITTEVWDYLFPVGGTQMEQDSTVERSRWETINDKILEYEKRGMTTAGASKKFFNEGKDAHPELGKIVKLKTLKTGLYRHRKDHKTKKVAV